MRTIKIFISSPSDLSRERKLLYEYISINLQRMIGNLFDVTLKPYVYEFESSAQGIGAKPMQRIGDVEDTNLYIGMFYTRYGSKTGNYDEFGKEYDSGTVEEFDRAVKAKNVEVKLLRKLVKNKKEIKDEKQYKKLEKFFNNVTSSKSLTPGIVSEFSNDDELKDWITNFVIDYVKETDDRTELNKHYKNKGLSNLYTQEDNDKRNNDKVEALKSSKNIKLVARCGRSYLYQDDSGRFSKYVIDCLENGGTFSCILTIPYSETGLYITAGDVKSSLLAKEKYSEKISELKEKTNLIDIISNSSWNIAKQRQAIEGYEELHKKYPNQTSLKMCSYEFSSTILILDNIIFMEPYMHCINSERGMNAFEVKIVGDNDNKIFKSVLEYYEFLDSISISLNEYEEKIDQYKEKLLNLIKK